MTGKWRLGWTFFFGGGLGREGEILGWKGEVEAHVKRSRAKKNKKTKSRVEVGVMYAHAILILV